MPSDFGEDAIQSSKELTRELEMILNKYARRYTKTYTEKYGIKGDAEPDLVDAIPCDDPEEARMLAEDLKRCGVDCAIADVFGEEERLAFEAGSLSNTEGGRVVVAKARDLGNFMAKRDFLAHRAERKDVAAVAAEEKQHVAELAAEKNRDHGERAGKEQDRGIDPNSR